MMAPGGGGNWSAPGEAAMARPAAAAAARGRENMIAVDVEGMMWWDVNEGWGQALVHVDPTHPCG